jgi:hydrogenase maturation factor
MDEVNKILQAELGNEMQAGRLRVVDWLTVDPLALLKEGNVVCSVHHGGANSFYESTT